MLATLGFTFHHIGVACRDIEAEAKAWLMLGYVAEAPDFEDPIQQVRGRFLVGAGPRLELLMQAGPQSPIPGILRRDTKFYHMAYVGTAFDDAIAALRQKRCKITTDPAPAVAFGGRRIAFLILPNMNVIELVEAEK